MLFYRVTLIEKISMNANILGGCSGAPNLCSEVEATSMKVHGAVVVIHRRYQASCEVVSAHNCACGGIRYLLFPLEAVANLPNPRPSCSQTSAFSLLAYVGSPLYEGQYTYFGNLLQTSPQSPRGTPAAQPLSPIPTADCCRISPPSM